MPNKAWQQEISRLVELGEAQFAIVAWTDEVVLARGRPGRQPELARLDEHSVGQLRELLAERPLEPLGGPVRGRA